VDQADHGDAEAEPLHHTVHHGAQRRGQVRLGIETDDQSLHVAQRGEVDLGHSPTPSVPPMGTAGCSAQ
jgi:hypothetical protein